MSKLVEIRKIINRIKMLKGTRTIQRLNKKQIKLLEDQLGKLLDRF